MRPSVILHLLQSIDGRVTGGFMGKALSLVGDYGAIRRELDGDCVIYGATTAGELFAHGHDTPKRSGNVRVPAGDYVAEKADFLFCVIDPEATLAYDSAWARRSDMEGHIVALLTEDVDAGYLSRLREVGVSYLLCGTHVFDAAVALEKLGDIFGRRRALLMGGGYADGTMAAAGCVDELSLVVAPVAEVKSGRPSLFETVEGLDARPQEYELLEVRKLPSSGLWLHYRAR